MRRVIAISLAIAVLMFAARGVMAQDTGQDGNDLLLKILKDRNILTEKEYQDIKGQIAQQQTAVDQKLTALDRSLADYLAKAGDSSAGNTSYIQNQGVTFSSGDGMYSIFFGGLFQFGYRYATTDEKHFDPRGGFSVYENRLDFGGTVFDPNFTFYVQADAAGGFWLLDAYANWQVCDWAQIRGGQFKVPYGRQHMIDQSDRAFGRLNMIYGMLGDGTGVNTAVGRQFADLVEMAQEMDIQVDIPDNWQDLFDNFPVPATPDRDVGIMAHNVADLDDNADGMKLEWAVGLWNGSGNVEGGGNTAPLGTQQFADTWLMYGGRLGFYPMGMIDYVEGDWAMSADPKFGIAASYFDDTTKAVDGHNPGISTWEVDGVLTWNGLYFTGEYHSTTVNKYMNPIDEKSLTHNAWFVQAGYFVMPEVEVMGSYGMANMDKDTFGGAGYFETGEWVLGAAYYFNGHEWKIMGEIGGSNNKPKGLLAEVMKEVKSTFFRLTLQADW